MNQQLPVSIWKRGSITYYSINFQQHKKIVDSFFNSVKELFVCSRGKEFKI